MNRMRAHWRGRPVITRDVGDLGAIAFIAAAISAIVATVAAWLTHSVWAIRVLMAGGADAGQIVLAVLGVICPPVGVIHGVVLWLA